MSGLGSAAAPRWRECRLWQRGLLAPRSLVAKRIGLNVSARTGLCCYNRPMSVYVLALLIGVVAGLRAMTAPAVVSWAAYLGRMHLEGTWLAFLKAQGRHVAPFGRVSWRTRALHATPAADQMQRRPAKGALSFLRSLVPERSSQGHNRRVSQRGRRAFRRQGLCPGTDGIYQEIWRGP
jgi:hypothetical protein